MNIFEIGQKISISFVKDGKTVEMTCQIAKTYDDRLELILPSCFMRYIANLQVGCHVMSRAFSENGTLDFNSVIISSPFEEHFLVELDYNAVRINNDDENKFVNALLDLYVNVNNEFIKLKTFEVSSKYIKFNSKTSLNVGCEYNFLIYFPDDLGKVDFKAEITDNNDIYEDEYTASIITMTLNNRQTLIYFMYLYSKKII